MFLALKVQRRFACFQIPGADNLQLINRPIPRRRMFIYLLNNTLDNTYRKLPFQGELTWRSSMENRVRTKSPRQSWWNVGITAFLYHQKGNAKSKRCDKADDNTCKILNHGQYLIHTLFLVLPIGTKWSTHSVYAVTVSAAPAFMPCPASAGAAETANGAVERMVLLGLTSRIIPNFAAMRSRRGRNQAAAQSAA